MNYKTSIESLPEKNYLAIKGFMSWREILPDEYSEWERRYGFSNRNLIDQLKLKTGADEAYSLFCNSCRRDEQFDWVCGNDLACENNNYAPESEEFKIIRLAPSEYLRIEYSYGNEMTGEQAAKEADDYFWNEWLKNNPYKSKIEGDYANDPETADVTFYDDENRRVIQWHPILKI